MAKRSLLFWAISALLALQSVASAGAQTANIPIFQYAIFYNGLLEFSTCATMTINGHVHCNTNIYVGAGSGATLLFDMEVTACGTISAPANNGSSWTGPTTYNPSNWRTTFAGSPTNYVTNAAVAQFTTPTSDPHSLIDIPITNDWMTTAGALRLYNQAQVVLLVSNTTVNYVVQQAPNSGTVSAADPSPYVSPMYATNAATLVANLPFLTITNRFFDGRELKTNLTTQIDVGKYATWMSTNVNILGPGHTKFTSGTYPTILYVADNRTVGAKQLAVVRLTNGIAPPVNGGQGWSVATPNPLYVWGNYNQTNASFLGTSNTSSGTVPCALMSDALTILSANWNDRNSMTNSYSDSSSAWNAASVDTVNAAIVTGIVPSTGSSTTTFSGGVHNLPRLLEDWSSSTLWLNTSLVNLYNSARATNQFVDPGTYYEPPTRKFNHDYNFSNSNNQPPGTPILLSSPLPVILQQPVDQTVFSGDTVVFSVNAAGYNPLTYQWLFNGIFFAFTTNSFFTLSNVQFSEAGNYAVIVHDGSAWTMSSNAVLTVLQPEPNILTQPTNQTVIVGGTANFAVTVTGSSALSYQWSFNGTMIDAATNALLALDDVQLDQAGDYAVEVTNAFGSVTSTNAFLTIVGVPPAILIQPSNQIAVVGDAANFTVVADGTSPLSYQWSLNGTNIDGATNVVFTLTNVQPEDAGDYAVQVDNAYGSATSTNAVLTVVGVPPTIISQPSNQQAFLGSAASFSVVVGGTPPLSYQWSLNGTDIPSATGASYTVAAVQSNNVGNYTVTASSPYGMAVSSNATLTLLLPPVILMQPQSQSVSVRSNATFNVFATSSQPLNYQWMKNGSPLIDGGNVSGVATASLTLSGVTTPDAGSYTVVISNVLGSVVSQPAELFVNFIPGQVVAWGDYLTDDFVYAPMIPPTNLTNVVAIAGGGAHSLALQADGTVVGFGDNSYGQISVPIGLSGVVAISAGAFDSLALKNDGTVVAWGWNYYGQTSVPSSLTNVMAIAAGDFHTLALNSDGTVVAWGDDSYGQTNLPVGLSNVLAIAAGSSHSLALQADGTVVAWGWNAYGQANVPAGLTNVVAIACGSSHSLALQVNGTVVAWGLNADGQTSVPPDLTNAVAIAGGGAHSLAIRTDGTVVAWGLDGDGQTNVPSGLTNALAIAGGAVDSLALVEMPPSIVTPPQSQTVLQGSNATFWVAAIGRFPLSFQWIFNTTNLVGDGTDSLTLTNVQPQDAGNYAVLVSDDAGSVTSIVASLTVGVPPSIITLTQSQMVIQGSNAMFTVTADGTDPLSFQWFFNQTNAITDATNACLTLCGVTQDQSGDYSVTVTNDFGSVTSDALILSVYTWCPPTLSGFSFSTEVGAQFGVAGVPGWNYAVEASTNLIDWEPLITNTSPFSFVDTNTFIFPQHFYRARYSP